MKNFDYGFGNLIGIVVLALLTLSMIPQGVEEAKQKALATTCSQHLKMLTLATLQYEQDKGQFPPGRQYLNGSDKKGVATDMIKWSNAIAPYLHADPAAVTSMSNGSKEVAKALAALPPGDLDKLYPDTYLCPGATERDRAGTNSGYGYNYQYLGDATPLSLVGAQEKGFVNFPVKKSAIARPDRTISFADSEGTGWKSYISAKSNASGPALDHEGAFAYLLDPPFLRRRATKDGGGITAPAAGAFRVNNQGELVLEAKPTHQAYRSVVSGRHQGSANVAFIDGHVETLSVMEIYFARTQESAGTRNKIYPSNALWNGQGTDNDENGNGRIDADGEKLIDPNEAFSDADGSLSAAVLPFYDPHAAPSGLSSVTGLTGAYANFGPGFEPGNLCDLKAPHVAGPTLPRTGSFDFSWIR